MLCHQAVFLLELDQLSDLNGLVLRHTDDVLFIQPKIKKLEIQSQLSDGQLVHVGPVDDLLLPVVIHENEPLIVAEDNGLISVAEDAGVDGNLPRIQRAELMAPQVDDFDGFILADGDESVLADFGCVLQVNGVNSP